MRKINIYDFDYTIYRGDSSLDFWIFCIAKKPTILKRLPVQVIALILKKIKVINTTKFKSIFFSFLKDFDSQNLERNINLFWHKKKVNFEDWFLNRDKQHYEVVISASPEFLLKDICRFHKVDTVIGTDMDYSGKIYGLNCKGEEKLNRLNKIVDNYIIDEFYSDCISDLPLAKLANKPFLVKKDNLKEWIL